MGTSSLFLLLLATAVLYLRITVLATLEQELDKADALVKEIAAQASANYKDKCRLIWECSNAPCSRVACSPLKDDVRRMSCVNVPRNLECNVNTTCNQRKVSLTKPHNRIFSVSSSQDSGFLESICIQKPLDQTLSRLWNASTVPAANLIFFGSHYGFLKSYPGRDFAGDDGCFKYDPRKRPWYVSYLAIVKSLFIVLDTSPSMSNPVSLVSPTTALDAAKNIIADLLSTLTNQDTVAVADIAGSPIGKQLLISKSTPDELGDLRDSVNKVGISNTVADMNTTLLKALSFFSPFANSKFILILTDGDFASGLNLTALDPVNIEQLNAKNVVVFLYTIGSVQPGSSVVLQQMKSQLNMTVDNVLLVDNPLFSIRSYFDYVAWLCFTAKSKSTVWVPVYEDNGGYGNVTTVAYPAFDDNQRLIGVAGVEISADQLSVLGSQASIEEAVLRRSNYKPLVITSQGPPNIVNESSSCPSPAKLDPLCQREDFSRPRQDFVCCPSCLASKPKGSKWKTAYTIGVAAAVLVSIVCGVLCWYYRDRFCSCFQGKRVQQQPLPERPEWRLPELIKQRINRVTMNQA